MSRYGFAKNFCTITLALLLVVPVSFLANPPRAHALDVVHVIQNTSLTDLTTMIKSTITSVASVTSSVANVALQIDKYVLEPIAYVISGALLRSITSGIIAFVAGTANGTGVPQFVQNLSLNLQTLSDGRANAFFTNFSQSSNSPFSASIVSSLRTNYLYTSSQAGFFAQNKCTLGSVSPNQTAFLAGNWSQGGLPAWFALTTQPQNNPYMLYNNSQSQLLSVVTGAQQVRLQELSWGNGFMSWCGATPAGAKAPSGFLPGDACTKADGTPGVILTPGAVIKSSLDKAIGVPIDRLINVGNVAPEVNSIFSNIATVMKTVSLGQQILGQLGSCGLSGVVGACSSSGLSSGGTSPLQQYQNSSDLGVTLGSVYSDAGTQAAVGGGMPARIQQYQSDWNTIGMAVDAASSSVQSLINYCQSQATNANGAIINAAHAAMNTQIIPAANQVAAANTAILNAEAALQRVAVEQPTDSSAGAAAASQSSFMSDTQLLLTMSPTASDVAKADQEAASFGDAVATPPGSLNVSGTSLIDRLHLINTNAQSSFSACMAQPFGSVPQN